MPQISWVLPSGKDDRSKLDRWCQAIGPAVFRSPEEAEKQPKERILLVNWNVHVGNGSIEGLIQDLTAQERATGHGEPDFVFLLQEAFRRSPDVPETVPAGSSIPGRISTPAEDIEAIAEKLDWWLFYAPSMRNGNGAGDKAEDRGNAILSSLPLESLQVIELPFSVQRRAAVAATVYEPDNDFRLRVAAVHLDTRAPLHQGFIFGAPSARNRQAQWLADTLEESLGDASPLVLGGDLNSFMGPLESSIDTLNKVAAHLNCGPGATHASGVTLDHVFVRLVGSFDTGPCRRLDSRFDSDHYPLVLPLTREFSRTRLGRP